MVMVGVAWRRLVVLAGMLSVGAAPAAGTVSDEEQKLAEALAAPARMFAGAADLEMRFIQEDGPESGHVRVVLTPELRPLSVMEARAAAEQAFLRTLDEPGLGDHISKVTVVVRLRPASHPDPGGAEQVFRYLHKGGREWGIFVGE